MDDWELIRSYAESQSESAFKALVERYAGLVYGSALRQAGDAELARDIAQAVFILLARKAPTFHRKTVVSGWLFQTTRFVTSRAIRAEQRRQRREQEAVEMYDLNSTDAVWRQMEPVIDDALQELGRADRDAILIRYVDGCSLREVGERLGVTEDAAKKRVGRAIEKLRLVLTRRGVSLSTAFIGIAIASGVNAAIPAPLVASIYAGGVAAAASGSAGALVAEAIRAWRWGKIRAAGGIAVMALLIATFVTVTLPRVLKKVTNSRTPIVVVGGGATANANASVPSQKQSNQAGYRILRLQAVDAINGGPITNAMVAFMVFSDEKPDQHFDLVTDSSGRCDIPFPPKTEGLAAGVLTAGWIARFAMWPSEGITEIPNEYTLRLERTTNLIGGKIVEPNGQPLANAEVWFEAHGLGDHANRERARERFGFIDDVPVRTDEQGRWSMGFVSTNNPGFSLWATHEQFAKTDIISIPREESSGKIDKIVEQLWASRLVTPMKQAWTLTGKVIDAQGGGIPRAKIQEVRQEEFWTDSKGTFRVPRLAQGPWEFTVSAEGFAPIRTNVAIDAGTLPLLLTLQTGAVLRLRVVDDRDVEAFDATVGLQQWGEYREALEWEAKTDLSGRVEWLSAPPGVDLELYAKKDGFCYTRDVKLRADGKEHIIQLQHTLDVYGRVVDAENGFAVREFKAVPGYGFQHHDDEQHWFALETVAGTNGLFKLTFVEKDMPWQIRITANGYEDWISDRLETNEQSATLDIPLKRDALAESVRGTVLNPDGQPVVGAQLALLALNNNVHLLPKGAFEGNKRWLTTSDQNGQFRFPVNRSAHGVAALSPDGYAQVRVREFGQMITLELQPWGSVSGTIDSAAKTYHVETIELYDPAADNYQGRVSLLGGYSTKLDPDGRFTFEKVPPGEFSVFINSRGGLSYHHQTPLKVTPGQTTEVAIVEKPGVLLKGRVIAPEGVVIDWGKDRIVFQVERESLRFAPGWSSKDDNKLEAVDYWTSQVAREFVNSRRDISLDVRPDGSFVSVERVPAGDYRLWAAFKNASTHQKVTVSEEQEALAELDIGAIELRGRNR